jgi:hypothetical protein
MQLEQLIRDQGVGFYYLPGAKLDRSLQDKWQRESRGYSCRLVYQNRVMTVDFWQGQGIKSDPSAQDVLDCLLSDASSFDNARDFEDWASEFGFNIEEDPELLKRDRKIYSNVRRQTERLKKLLGKHYEEFLEAER